MDTRNALPTSLTLAHQGIFNVPDAAGVEIVCQEGTVWVTLDNDERDYVLEAGDSFTTTEHRRAMLYALAPSRLALATRQSRKPTIETFNRFQATPLMNAAR
jgi:hypothetical protein